MGAFLILRCGVRERESGMRQSIFVPVGGGGPFQLDGRILDSPVQRSRARYTDQEDGDSEDSQRTRSYDHQADLVLDEAHWSLMTAEEKICANTGSFTVPREIERNPVLLGRVKGTFSPSPRCGFSHQKRDQNHVDQVCKNMTEDDRALLVLYSSKQESLKASSTSALIGKKRKEATATEMRAYQKQFFEAKQLQCKSWLDNEVFDLVDTRKKLLED